MFKISIETDNDAFQDDPHAEIARILKDVARRIEEGRSDGGINDFNGNRVGSFEYKP